MPLKSRRLEHILTTYSPRTASEVDQRMRRLREDGRLPKGARGSHAPDLSASDAVTMLIAVAGALTANESIVTNHTFPGLKSSETGRTLREALSEILETQKEVQVVRLWLDSRKAEIVHADGKVEAFGARDVSQSGGRAGRIVQVAEIGGALLKLIGHEIAA